MWKIKLTNANFSFFILLQIEIFDHAIQIPIDHMRLKFFSSSILQEKWKRWVGWSVVGWHSSNNLRYNRVCFEKKSYTHSGLIQLFHCKIFSNSDPRTSKCPCRREDEKVIQFTHVHKIIGPLLPKNVIVFFFESDSTTMGTD